MAQSNRYFCRSKLSEASFRRLVKCFALETRGFMKVLISPDDRILGFTAFGSGTAELLPVFQLAMTANLPYSAIHSLILTHPTLSEGLIALFNAIPKIPA